MKDKIKKIIDIIFMTISIVVNIISVYLSKVWSLVKRIFQFTYEACDVFIKELINKIKRSENKIILFFFSTKTFYLSIFIVLCIVFFSTITQIFYTVQIGSTAVVTTFGKVSRTAEPGLNFKIPFIEQVFMVNTGNLLQETYGFRMIESSSIGILSPKQIAENSYLFEQITASDAGTGIIQNELTRDPRVTANYGAAPSPEAIPTSSRLVVNQIRKIPEILKREAALGYPIGKKAVVPVEATLLTGNLNILTIRWAIQFEITDPVKYLFSSSNNRENMRNLSLAILRASAGNYKDTEIISEARSFIENDVLKKTQTVFKKFNLGIKVVAIILLEISPPEKVKPSFDDVAMSQQRMEKRILEARKLYNQVVPRAKGEAEKLIHTAKGYSAHVRSTADGEAKQYTLVEKEYRDSKEVTKTRLYLETIEAVFKKSKVTFLDPDVKGILPIYYDNNKKNSLDFKKIENEIALAVKKQLDEHKATNKSNKTSKNNQQNAKKAP